MHNKINKEYIKKLLNMSVDILQIEFLFLYGNFLIIDEKLTDSEKKKIYIKKIIMAKLGLLRKSSEKIVFENPDELKKC